VVPRRFFPTLRREEREIGRGFVTSKDQRWVTLEPAPNEDVMALELASLPPRCPRPSEPEDAARLAWRGAWPPVRSALLETHDNNISAAARAAGIERMSIYKRIRRPPHSRGHACRARETSIDAHLDASVDALRSVREDRANPIGSHGQHAWGVVVDRRPFLRAHARPSVKCELEALRYIAGERVRSLADPWPIPGRSLAAPWPIPGRSPGSRHRLDRWRDLVARGKEDRLGRRHHHHP